MGAGDIRTVLHGGDVRDLWWVCQRRAFQKTAQLSSYRWHHSLIWADARLVGAQLGDVPLHCTGDGVSGVSRVVARCRVAPRPVELNYTNKQDGIRYFSRKPKDRVMVASAHMAHLRCQTVGR